VTSAQGEIRLDAGLPDARRKTLEVWLESLLDSARGSHRTALDAPVDEDGRLSLDPRDWGTTAGCHPLLLAYADLVASARLALAFETHGPCRPRFKILPRLRSSCPDLEQLRRFGLAGVFEPPRGRVFLVVRLHHLELRALAATCERRLGRSTLAEIFRGRQDPVAHVAAALSDVAGDLHADDRSRLAELLLAAAAAGLGPQAVREMARRGLGLDDRLKAGPLRDAGQRTDRLLVWARLFVKPEHSSPDSEWIRRLLTVDFNEHAWYVTRDGMLTGWNFHRVLQRHQVDYVRHELGRLCSPRPAGVGSRAASSSTSPARPSPTTNSRLFGTG
jgi:hypothetical protein